MPCARTRRQHGKREPGGGMVPSAGGYLAAASPCLRIRPGERAVDPAWKILKGARGCPLLHSLPKLLGFTTTISSRRGVRGSEALSHNAFFAGENATARVARAKAMSSSWYRLAC